MQKLIPIADKGALKKQLDLFINNPENLGADACEFIKQTRRHTETYIIGGTIRNIHFNEQVRDVDMMLTESIEGNEKIKANLPPKHEINRMGGYKLFFEKVVMDIWSLDKNWANTSNVVKEKQILTKVIAQGTFLNFDSLVYALNSRALHVDNFNKCVISNKLDIVVHARDYIFSNPMSAAIVLRTIYLQKKYGFKVSNVLNSYICSQLLLIQYEHKHVDKFFVQLLEKYPKYKDLLNSDNIPHLLKNYESKKKLHDSLDDDKSGVLF